MNEILLSILSGIIIPSVGYFIYILYRKIGLHSITLFSIIQNKSNYEVSICSLKKVPNINEFLRVNSKNIRNIKKCKSESSLLDECHKEFSKYDKLFFTSLVSQGGSIQNCIDTYNLFITSQKNKVKD